MYYKFRINEMPVLINFKICDNSKDCNGPKVCPTGAFYWDEKRKMIDVDNLKCINCGKCEESCSVGAVRVAKNETEYKKIKKEIDKDSRKISDLFVDRYGAAPIVPAFQIHLSEFKIVVIEATKPAVVELFNQESIQCLLHSTPIKDLIKDLNVIFRKIEIGAKDSSFLKKYKIKKLPCLLFFNKGKLMGKIEGSYKIGKNKELKEKISKIFFKIK